MDENNREGQEGRFFGHGIYDLLGSVTAGAGTVAQAKIPDISTVIPYPWAGSAFGGIVGVIGLIYSLVALRSWRSWAIVVIGFILDMLLSVVFMWQMLDTAIADPLAVWPYALGTLATAIAGLVVGWLASSRPYHHAVAMVSIDMLLSGVSAFVAGQPLTWKLIVRVIVAYAAALVGAAIGQCAQSEVAKDRYALGKLFGKITVDGFVAIGSALAALILSDLLS